YLARAHDLYRRRGTVAALREYIRIYAGVDAHIEEPLLSERIWTLGESSALAGATMLADAAQTAVLGSTATVDHSRLDPGDVCCPTLYDDVAHRFCVRVYCGQLTRPGALEDVGAVLDREKPAHTTYELSIIEPMMRIGAQARVGIDCVVADGPPKVRFGT